jgi:hypothetical protein
VTIVHHRGPIGNHGTAGGKQQAVDRTPEEVAMGITREIPAGEPFGLAGRIIVDEPGPLINVTPGPGGQHRPIREA